MQWQCAQYNCAMYIVCKLLARLQICPPILAMLVFIGPESDHCLLLSLTHCGKDPTTKSCEFLENWPNKALLTQ